MHSIASPNTSSVGSGSNPPSPAPTNANNMLNGNDFISLLTAELKHQDPTNPMDPTQFVSQLVQFNSLEQLISINQDLQPASGSGTGSGTGTGSGANAGPQPTPSGNPQP